MYYGRGLNKMVSPYTLQHMYKEYILDKEEGSPYNVPYSTFVNIITTYYKEVVNYLLNGGVYTLPFNMGNMLIVKYRPRKRTVKNTPIDWENTNKYGKVIRFTNDHSNYYKFLINWNKSTCKVTNKSLYRFIPTREFKRTLAAKIKRGEHDFFEL